jgi:hypothetical protein
MSAPELELLGALAFFFALHKYGREAGLAPVLPVLFPHRAEEYHHLVQVAFDAIMGRFEWLRLRVARP